MDAIVTAIARHIAKIVRPGRKLPFQWPSSTGSAHSIG
jgi:hypothetical protein